MEEKKIKLKRKHFLIIKILARRYVLKPRRDETETKPEIFPRSGPRPTKGVSCSPTKKDANVKYRFIQKIIDKVKPQSVIATVKLLFLFDRTLRRA